MRNIVLSINHDSDVPAPESNWSVVSFNRNHINYEHPENYFPLNLGLRSKKNAGLLHVLDYYQHSEALWSIHDEGPQCRWDNTQNAGILIWNGKPNTLPKNQRAQSARDFLNLYNDWANGHTYYFNASTPEGYDIYANGGFIGENELVEDIFNFLQPGDTIKVVGDCHWIRHELKLPQDAKTVREFDEMFV